MTTLIVFGSFAGLMGLAAISTSRRSVQGIGFVLSLAFMAAAAVAA